MDDTTIWIIVLIGLGAILGFFVARRANEREQTHSGSFAQLLNFLAAALIAMVAPTALCNVFFIHPHFLGDVFILGFNLTLITHVVLIVFVMIITALALMTLYALLEKPHLERVIAQEDRGWTREDAEQSGL